MVTLATLAMANAAFKLQLARNHTALNHAAISAVSRMLSFSSGGSATVVPSSTVWTVVACEPYDMVLRGLSWPFSCCGNGLYPLPVSLVRTRPSRRTEQSHSASRPCASASKPQE